MYNRAYLKTTKCPSSELSNKKITQKAVFFFSRRPQNTISLFHWQTTLQLRSFILLKLRGIESRIDSLFETKLNYYKQQ